MDKVVEELTIKDLIRNCQNGCDNCARELARVCKQTYYMLVNLKKSSKEDLQHIVNIDTESIPRDRKFNA